ncbi:MULTISPECIES: hypothetical protein [unclassified Nodosilinea]|uniref:Uncharacterized protein n=1 Tax=Leptolyngbya subtilissima DQ-A4 TaxID=2933933 RepID=A0ABV0K447_9CYAN|nr:MULTISPECIES: hypothetical protein [unclassified Nodosilinea]MBD2106873.1 hypothetical protein [Nodosilinea sp. FACHB-13]MBD2113535.1 hypothetical protein [Nodosilinea sp. FACHB-141]
MSEPTLSNQQTNPDQAVIASEHAQLMAPTNASGSAMLDAHAAAGEAQPEGDPVESPIATNFSTASTSGDAKTADVATVSGPSTVDQSSEQGQVNLQNNPDIPGEGMQGTLPNTDPIGIPLDPDTNLEE